MRMRGPGQVLPATILAALLLAGCSESPAPRQSAPDAGTSTPRVVRIVFDLPGDEIGGPEAQALLDDISAALLQRKAGEVLRTGHGMGESEIVVQYPDDEGLEAVKKAIAAARPGAKYRILRGPT